MESGTSVRHKLMRDLKEKPHLKQEPCWNPTVLRCQATLKPWTRRGAFAEDPIEDERGETGRWPWWNRAMVKVGQNKLVDVHWTINRKCELPPRVATWTARYLSIWECMDKHQVIKAKDAESGHSVDDKVVPSGWISKVMYTYHANIGRWTSVGIWQT